MRSEQRSRTFVDPQPVECGYFETCTEPATHAVAVEIVGEGTTEIVACDGCTDLHLDSEHKSRDEDARRLSPAERWKDGRDD